MLWFQCRIWTIPKKFDSGDILINMLFSLAYIATKGWPQPNILATGVSVISNRGIKSRDWGWRGFPLNWQLRESWAERLASTCC